MLTYASIAVILILSTSMAVGIGKYLRSKARGRRCGKYAVDATAAVYAVPEGLHMRSTRCLVRPIFICWWFKNI